MDHTDPAFHGTVVALVIIIVVCAIALSLDIFY